jgi:hypothetical protein
MDSTNLKGIIAQVIGQEWTAFAQRHPMLAEAIDHDVLIEQCAQSIRQTPEYQHAMEQVETTGLAIEVLQELITKLAQRAIRLV